MPTCDLKCENSSSFNSNIYSDCVFLTNKPVDNKEKLNAERPLSRLLVIRYLLLVGIEGSKDFENKGMKVKASTGNAQDQTSFNSAFLKIKPAKDSRHYPVVVDVHPHLGVSPFAERYGSRVYIESVGSVPLGLKCECATPLVAGVLGVLVYNTSNRVLQTDA